MFKPVEMSKLLLLATKNAESRLISALHEKGVMEIRAFEVPGLDRGKPLPVNDTIAGELVRIRALIRALDSLPFARKDCPLIEQHQPDYARSLAEASRLKLDDALRRLVDERTNLIARESALAREKADISRLSGFAEIDFSAIETRDFTYTSGFVNRRVAGQMRKDLEDYLQGECEILASRAGESEEAVLVFYPKKENIEFVLSRYGFKRIATPQGFTTFEKGVAAMDANLAALRGGIAEAEKKISDLSAANYCRLLDAERQLSLLSERATISVKFAAGRQVVAIEGWVKKKDVAGLGAMLEARFKGESEIVELHGSEEDAPIALDNPKSLSPFQFLVEFYSLPVYGELDPTFILLFTVPITYGMILGDVGYGLVSVFLSLLILRKFKDGMLGNVAKIWLFSSFAAMVFGVVFDEWFGFTHLELAELLGSWGLNLGIAHALYEGISRSHNLSLVIGLTLLVGVAQLSLGFMLGMINAWHHDKKHVAAKAAWLFLLLGGTVGVSSLMFNLLPAQVGQAGLAIAAICGVAITILEGLPGMFEIPGIAANAFSYARIAAAGVAGVIIAEIINQSFTPKPPGGLVLIPIFIFLHILNAGLAMFESIVQGARLNLVEFYSKFYQGGGKEFRPFSMEKAKKA